jgi:serine/threonine protein kinase
VDIFSIGAIIYFMLSGELPFNSENLEFLVERTLT